MPRCFIAVKVPALPAIVELIESLDQLGSAVRAVNPKHLHATLRFLGDVDQEVQPLIGDAMEQATAGVGQFEMKLQGVGVFPDKRRPTVIWAGAEAQSAEPVKVMAKRLIEPLADLGFEPERRPFNLHVTLARIKRKPPDQLDRIFERYADAQLGTCTVEKVELINSELTPNGPVYSTGLSVNLAGG